MQFKNDLVAFEQYGGMFHMICKLPGEVQRKVVAEDMRDLYYFLGEVISQYITAYEVLNDFIKESHGEGQV